MSNIWDTVVDATPASRFTFAMTSSAARKRVDGISVALEVLDAVGNSRGIVALKDLTELAPRSTLYRVVRTMAAAGILTRTRGAIAPGAIAAHLLDQQLRQLRGEPIVPASANQADIAEAGGNELCPIPLSKPRRWGPPRHGLRIGFSNISLSNPWRVALVHAVERAAARLDSRISRFAVCHADDNAAKQAADIFEMVEAGVDGLIVSAAISPLVRDAIHAAMRCGVEVVMVDRGMQDTTPTSFVSTSDAAIGRITAQWLAETLNGCGGVVLLAGVEAAEPAQRRLAAAAAVFARFPGIRILQTSWTGWQSELGYRAAADAISRFDRQISGVWCDSGLQGVGSMKAFIKSGWKHGPIPPHTGGDLNLAYKLSIRHQIRLAAVDNPPAMGMKALEVLVDALSGRYVPTRIEVPLEVILTKGCGTASVSPDLAPEDRVRWDLPDELVLASGLGPTYSPRAFRIHYRGNRYNRSAARPGRHSR